MREFFTKMWEDLGRRGKVCFTTFLILTVSITSLITWLLLREQGCSVFNLWKTAQLGLGGLLSGLMVSLLLTCLLYVIISVPAVVKFFREECLSPVEDVVLPIAAIVLGIGGIVVAGGLIGCITWLIIC